MVGEGLTVADGGGLEARLREVAARIRGGGLERGYILANDGSVRQVAQDGGVGHVWLAVPGMRRGEVAVHNHVAEAWSPPSPDDWLAAVGSEGEMWVVSAEWDYWIRPPATGWPVGRIFKRYWTGQRALLALNLTEMIKAVPGRIEAQLPHWLNDEQRRTQGSEAMHAAWSWIAQEVGADYGRVRVEDSGTT